MDTDRAAKQSWSLDTQVFQNGKVDPKPKYQLSQHKNEDQSISYSFLEQCFGIECRKMFNLNNLLEESIMDKQMK